MHWTGFAARRARSRAGLLVAAAAIVAVTGGSMAGILGAVGGGIDDGVAELLAAASPTASAVRVETRLAADPETQFRQVEDALTTAIGDAPLELTRSVRTVPLDASIDGDPVSLLLGTEPALESRAVLVAGEWPDAAAGPDAAAVVRSTAADRLGLAPGDTIAIDDTELRVSGTWAPTDASDPSWFSDESVGSGFSGESAGPVLVDDDAFARLVADLDLDAQVRWTISPDSTMIGTAELASLSQAIPRIEAAASRLYNAGAAITVTGGLADTVVRASRAGGAVTGVVAVPLLLLAILGGIVLALVARALAGGRSGEEVLLRGRGLSGTGRGWLAVLESTIVAVLGSAVGVGVVVATLPVDPWTAWVVAATVAVAAVIILTIAVITGRPVDARSEDSGRKALVTSVGPLILATIAAAVAAAQLFAADSPVIVRADGSVRIDVLALAAPALLLVAVGLVARVAATPVLAVVERFSARGAGILPVLPARQLARRTRTVAAALLVVMLGAGVVTYAAAFDATATSADASRSGLAAGGGVRIQFGPAGAKFPVLGQDAAQAYSDLDGVDSAIALSREVATVGKDAAWLLVVDADQLRRLEASYAALPTPSIEAKGDHLPVLLTAQLASRIGVVPGDVISVDIRTIPAPIVAVVAAIVPELPTTGVYGMLAEPAALEAAAAHVGESAPEINEVWLATTHPQRAAAAARAVTTRPVEVLTRAGASDAAVLRVGTSLAWVGAIACLVLALIGFAAVAGALHRERRPEGVALRSLGFGAADQARSRAIELGLTAASAILLGVGVGALAAWLTMPALAGELALAVVPWLIALAALAAGLLGIGLFAANRVARDVARGGRA